MLTPEKYELLFLGTDLSRRELPSFRIAIQFTNSIEEQQRQQAMLVKQTVRRRPAVGHRYLTLQEVEAQLKEAIRERSAIVAEKDKSLKRLR